MRNQVDWKNLGSAFSLATLWFTNVWREFIFSNSANFYFDHEPFLEYSAMIINLALATIAFLGLIKLSSCISNIWSKRLFQIFFLVLGLSAFCGLGSEIMRAISPKTTTFVNALLPVIVLIICMAFSVRKKFAISAILNNLKTISLFLLPFALLVCFQLLWIWFGIASVQFSSAKGEKVVSEKQKLSATKKVIWIIFDGLDYEALNAANFNNADLSDIDRLTDESFVAENAFSPNFGTQESLPALLAGRPLKRAVPASINDITLYPEDNSEAFSLRNSENLIAQLSDSGIKIGVAGWTHPYPRIFSGKISEGYFHSLQHAQCFSLAECSAYLYRMSLQTIPLMTRFFPALWFDENINQVERHKFLSSKADELIANPEYNFLFFHFSIPHGPFINRQNSIADNYWQALEAVNDTIKRLRETLEKTGEWDRTVLIVSSDHYGRGKTGADFLQEQRAATPVDSRIPFIARFPGGEKRLDYKQPFNTVITKELILSIFKDEIKNSEELAKRLNDLAASNPELINFRPHLTEIKDN